MLRFIWAVGLTIVSSITFAQATSKTISDSFSDNDFSNDPPWFGSDTSFVIDHGKLRLNETESGTTSIAIESTVSYRATWQSTIHLGFNPSGSNYVRYYVVSNQMDLTSALNGYYVLLGGANDEISLYRQSGKTSSRIIDGEDGLLDRDTLSIQLTVERDSLFNWTIRAAIDGGEMITIGEVLDDLFLSSEYSGFQCRFTSTRGRSFYFDDVGVQGYPYAQTTNTPGYKDVLITEIFADPSPAVELPAAEYIELYNRSANTVRLSGWTVSDGSSTATLVGKYIDPGSYLIVCSSSYAPALGVFGDVTGVAGFPSLNNSSDKIVLRSSEGITIDSVSYSSAWYKDSNKKDGGWSLELIDITNVCGGSSNWAASTDIRGGTPGSANSIAESRPDLTGPALESVIPITSTELVLLFDEQLEDMTFDATQFRIQPLAPITGIRLNDSRNEIIVSLAEPIASGIRYELSVSGVRDCNGNEMNETENPIVFGLPQQANSMDVVINEILFNPYPGGVDFVELYNCSEKFVDVFGWSVGHFTDNRVQDTIRLDVHRLVEPGGYLLLSEDAERVKSFYPTTKLDVAITVSLPTMNDDEGSVALISSEGTFIDGMHYMENYHSPLLNNQEGVSLERISGKQDSLLPQNWASASSSAGYATPGQRNSNSLAESNNPNLLSLEPQVFEPIAGTPSHTQVVVRLNQAGYIGTLLIIDIRGRIIKTLANNEILGMESIYRWDGDSDFGGKASIGPYLVWLQAFNSNGDKLSERARVVIAAKF